MSVEQPANKAAIREIFLQALETRSPWEREAYLQVACGSDAALRAKVEALLRSHEDDSFLESPAVEVTENAVGPQESLTEGPGTVIGHYKLLEKLGEGGFGVVYMAEQQTPVKRRVALKIIKVGMDTREVAARFEAERQALAMMDHPNIAKVFDAGATEQPLTRPPGTLSPTGGEGRGAGAAASPESQIANRKSQIPSGRPYFVMELVRGVKITDYCDEKSLSTRERLHLFIQVCQAVQHAHQKGIIHRDLKPSNILVTINDGVAVPKIIDFGIAKATQAELTEKTIFTRFHQFIGTPAYMSPEQAEMTSLDIDTRSDIYSLGVLLYELLTGNTPFDSKDLLAAGLDEMRRTIREKEPARPSTRLTQELARASGGRLPRPARHERGEGGGRGVADEKPAAPQDASSPRPSPPSDGEEGVVSESGGVSSRRLLQLKELITLLRGDLDWIVMKCLEKDRARRYETANGLASDIQRHLNNEPVVACPPSNLYRFQKLIRRNKVAFTATAAVAAALLIGFGVATWMFFQERSAKQEQERLRQVADAARNQAKEDAKNARIAAAKSKQLAQFFDEMLQGVGPEVAKGRDATILKEILDKTAQRIGNGLANQPQSEAYLRESVAKVYLDLGDYQSAEAMQRRALELYRQLYPDGHRDLAHALDYLAVTLSLQGQLPEAERLSREAVTMGRKLLGAEHADLAAWMTDLAMILKHQRNYADAEAIYREALAMNRKLRGNEHREVVATLNNLAIVLAEQKKHEEAERLMREALQMGRHLWGNEHPLIARALTSLTEMLENQGKLQEAEATGREAVALEKKLSGPEHTDVATALANLAGVLVEENKLPEAEAMHREALAIRRKAHGNENPWVENSLFELGSVLSKRGALAEAESLLRECLDVSRKLPPNDYVDLERVYSELVKVLTAEGKESEAKAFMEEATSSESEQRKHPLK